MNAEFAESKFFDVTKKPKMGFMGSVATRRIRSEAEKAVLAFEMPMI